ncbi:unnamed protein product [Auanema sp. JU1783]|nr:unnamed protein product [Auanema sp. JU1783]
MALRRRSHDGRAASPIPEDPKPDFLPGWSRATNEIMDPAIHRARAPGHSHQEANSPPVRAIEPEQALVPAEREVISPSVLPGVRAIPPAWNRILRGRLQPGQYFAKSLTRYLGPFTDMPTVDDLPAGDTYVILQRMGRFPDTGKSIFRHVAQINS